MIIQQLLGIATQHTAETGRNVTLSGMAAGAMLAQAKVDNEWVLDSTNRAYCEIILKSVLSFVNV